MNYRSTLKRTQAVLAAVAISSCFSIAMASAAEKEPTVAALTAQADKGNAEAQYRLGEMYSLGSGVTEDDAAAFRWHYKAANQGYAPAQYKLALIYANGKGVTQDYTAAFRWFLKAANQGNAFAPFNLGGMYEDGRGVTQDYVQAHKWFSLAAARATNAFMKGMANQNKDKVAAMMTPAQIAEAQSLASDWKPQ